MADQLRKCLQLVDRSTVRLGGGVAVLIVVAAAFEAIGIGLIFPFIQIVADPQRVHEMDWISTLLGPVAEGGERRAIGLLAGGLVSVFVFKNLYLAGVYYVQAAFVFGNEARLSRRLLAGYLHAPYSFHLGQNSAELIRNLTNAVGGVFNGVFMGSLTIASEVCVAAALAAVLMYTEPTLALGAIAVLGAAIAIFYLFVRKLYLVWGERELDIQGRLLKSLQQGLHSIKEVRVLGREAYVLENYARPRRELAHLSTLRTAMSNAPRLWVETIMIMGVMSVVALILAEGGGSADVLATLTLFAAAAVRLIPSMNRILIALTGIKNSIPAVDIVHADMMRFAGAAEMQDAAGDTALLPFSRSLVLENLSFNYPGGHAAALEKIDLTIGKGESVGLAGASGAGKTTLVDIILGLLEPTNGRVLVDGVDIAGQTRAWRRQIGYVPQTIYLNDDTLRRNIAFGLDDEDIVEAQVIEAVRLARLDGFIEELPHGLDTPIGERGVRLSGGQRQRIGIARALYRDPSVLILDEATAALDNETEHEINQAIENLSGEKTLIIIAHRLSTIRKCDRVILLQDGRIADSGTFGELSGSNESFRRMVELGSL